MGIDDRASTNSSSWAERFALADDGSESLARFATFCGRSKVGTNVSSDKLRHFLELDPPRVVSTFEWKRRTVSEKVAIEETYTREPWGPRREVFEKRVGGYRRTIYGTLDMPRCVGDEDPYGVYRLVYTAQSPVFLLVLPHNSAAAYGTDDDAGQSQLDDDVALWTDRACVASVVFGNVIEAVPDEEWPAMIAGVIEGSPVEADLVEVVVRDYEVPVADLDEVRVAESEFLPRISALLRAMASTHDDATVDASALLAGRLDALSMGGTLVLDVVA